MTNVVGTLATSAGAIIGVVFVKASVLAVLGLLTAKLVHRASAARRAAFWTALAVGLALLPALRVTLPTIRIPFPARAVLVPPDATAVPTNPPGETAVAGGARGTSAPSTDPTPPRAEAMSGIALAVLVLVWATGVIANLCRMLGGVTRARRLVRRAVPVPPSHRAQTHLDAVARQLALGTSVRLYASDELAVPGMLGARRPTVVLPSACLDWDRPRLRAIMLHELAHVARGDYVARILWELIRAFYWANPLVLRAAATARTDTERAADDRVVTAGIDPIVYAEQLLDIARSAHASRRAMFALGVVSAPLSPLKLRVRAILDGATDRRRAVGSASLACALGVLGITAAVASLGIAVTREVMLEASIVLPAGLPSRAGAHPSDSVAWALTSESSARDTAAFQLLFAADPRERLSAARAVRAADSGEMAGDILAVFADTVGKCSGMRWRAARALRELRDARVVPQLVTQLVSDPNPDVRAMVANAIAAASTEDGARLLRVALADAPPELFGRVGRAIDTLGDTPARRTLLGALREARAQAYSRDASRPPRVRRI